MNANKNGGVFFMKGMFCLEIFNVLGWRKHKTEERKEQKEHNPSVLSSCRVSRNERANRRFSTYTRAIEQGRISLAWLHGSCSDIICK